MGVVVVVVGIVVLRRNGDVSCGDVGFDGDGDGGGDGGCDGGIVVVLVLVLPTPTPPRPPYA